MKFNEIRRLGRISEKYYMFVNDRIFFIAIYTYAKNYAYNEEDSVCLIMCLLINVFINH